MTDPQSSRTIPMPRRIRLILQVAAAIAVAFAVALVLAQRDAWPVSAVLVVAAGLVALRWARTGVDLSEDELVVRGFAFSTRIRRDQIVAVDRFPSIDWRGADGVTRETLVNAFIGTRYSPNPSEAEIADARAELQAWLDRRA
ncbi:hypothetical protein [Curtobacterium sp. Curtsp57]|uniref:hypothetical protein n=1 Tax=Curtobacterium sp. Curtsp57 TaxID=3243047 RepID=UPI0039B46427